MVRETKSTSSVEFNLVKRKVDVVICVLLGDGDGLGQGHVLVGPERLSDRRPDVLAEELLDHSRDQHRTPPLDTPNTPNTVQSVW